MSADYRHACEAARVAITDAINAAITKNPKLRDDAAKLFELVARSYPFGKRVGTQWRAWLEEMKYARAWIEDQVPAGASGIKRPCPVCRVRAGVPCISVGENDNLAPEFHAIAGQHNAIRGNKAPGRIPETQKEAVMHEARKAPGAPVIGVVSAA